MDRQAQLTQEAKRLIFQLGQARKQADRDGDNELYFRLTWLEVKATARWLRRYRAYQDAQEAP